MRSVPPRGSGWVVDGVAMTPREYSVLPSDRCGSRPTRYRVVVLTSSPSKHCFLSNTLMEHYLNRNGERIAHSLPRRRFTVCFTSPRQQAPDGLRDSHAHN